MALVEAVAGELVDQLEDLGGELAVDALGDRARHEGRLLLGKLHRTLGLTSLIATHNLALAARCDRVLTLEHGVLSARKAATYAGMTPGGEAS